MSCKRLLKLFVIFVTGIASNNVQSVRSFSAENNTMIRTIPGLNRDELN
jgi:hypothetical protein